MSLGPIRLDPWHTIRHVIARNRATGRHWHLHDRLDVLIAAAEKVMGR
jgi:hypothetical protein